VSEPVLRVARPADAESVQVLMQASVRDLFPGFHTPEQTASAVEHIAHLDPLLLADGTYFVLEAGDELVACGGWSRRAKLYAGSGPGPDDTRLLDPATEPARVRAMFVTGSWTRRGLARRILDASRKAAADEGFRELILMATMPGVPLYRAYGFTEVERSDIEMPDGTVVEGAVMTLTIELLTLT
jgi:GNAT superfamily N-acetyltransferase